jgi:hypothetical protein
MSHTEIVLRSKEAKEAYVEGLLTLLQTGNLQKGFDAMIAKGKKNGSYLAFKVALVLDFLKKLTNN